MLKSLMMLDTDKWNWVEKERSHRDSPRENKRGGQMLQGVAVCFYLQQESKK